MADGVSEFLTEKLGEYHILAAPLERAMREMEYAHQLLRARIEHEICDHVPALGALADILDISIIDLLDAPDRYDFVRDSMRKAGLTTDDVLQQLRVLGPPAAPDELSALGLVSGS
jgi:hypothetical protein